MNKMKMIVGVFIILSFLISPINAQVALDTSSTDDKSFNQTGSSKVESNTAASSTSQKTISWDVSNDSFSDTYSWTSSGWEFGPTPSYTMRYSNNAAVGLEDTVTSGSTLKIDIKVPLDAITSGNGLGQAGFSLYYSKDEYVNDPINPGSGYYQSTYYASGNYFYDVVNSNWQSYVYAYNYTTDTNIANVKIFNWNTAGNSATFDSVSKVWNIHIEGSFDSSVQAGRWNFNLNLYDSQYNYIDTYSYGAYNSNSAPYRDIWVNAPYQPNQYYGDYFNTQVLSNTLKPLDTVTKGVPFQFQINGSVSQGVSTVVWAVDLPSSYYELVNTTDTVMQQVTHNGAWVWNTTLNTYVWDPLPVNVSEPITVNKTVQSPIYLDTSVTDPNCPSGSVDCYVSSEQLFLIYDPLTDLVTEKIGHTVTNYSPTYTETYVFDHDVNLTAINETLFMFNGQHAYVTSGSNFQLTLNVSVNPLMYTQGYSNQIYYSVYLNNTQGMQVWGTGNYGSIYVDSPTAKIDVFNKNKQPAGQSLHVKLGDFFYVNMTLQGYSDISSLGAATLDLTGWDYSYSETSYTWTNLEILIRYYFDTQTYSIEAYNQTSREVTSDGSSYYQYYDQQLHTWVDGWPAWRTEATKISGNVLTVNQANLIKNNGIIELMLNLSSSLTTPEMRYSFQGLFEKQSFTQDYNAGRTKFTTDFWVNEPVLTLNGTYTDYLTSQQAVYYNGQYYKVNQVPYIETSPGVYADIKAFPSSVSYDSSSLSLYYSYTYVLGDYGNYYYELTNGTQINTQLKNGITIYQLLLANGSTFNTYSQYPNYIYNYNTYQYTYRLYTTSGSFIDFGTTYPTIGIDYSITKTTVVYIHNNQDGYLLPLYRWNSAIGDYELVKYQRVGSSYSQWDSNTGVNYFVDPTTKTRFNLNPTSIGDYRAYYEITIGGVTYYTSSWADYAYNVTYSGVTKLVSENFFGNYIINQYFFVAGTNSFLPVNANPATSSYELNYNVPVKYTFDYNGESVEYIYKYPNYELHFANGTISNISTSFFWETYANFVQIGGINYYVSTISQGTSLIYVNGQPYNANLSIQLIYKHLQYFDYPWRQVYQADWTVTTRTDTYELVIGNPRSNMWGYDIFTVNPDNGAVDLDGDLTTTNDQYFVERIWSSTNSYSYNYTRMNVNVYWDPNTLTYNNEYNLNAWMGYTVTSYSWDWNESYIWYYADNRSLVTPTDLQAIKDLVFVNITAKEASAGYWGISWMLINQTQQDVINEAKANGWDWIPETTWTTSWLDFGFDQSYNTYSNNNGQEAWSQINMRTEWNGLFIYNDTNKDGIVDFNNKEVTHMFIPASVGSVQFTTPAASLGLSGSSGSVTLSSTDPTYNNTADFGVQFFNVSGTTYPVMQDPFGNWINIWQWQQGDVVGSDLTNFTNRPTKAMIDEIGFQLHFSINPDPNNVNNAIANLKLDQTIGNWNLSSIKGRGSLKGYSLAITYLEYIQASSYSINDANNNQVSNDQTVVSDSFSFNTNGQEFGSAVLAGNYLWDKNQTLNPSSTTYSAPIGQFTSTYQSTNGDGTTFGFNLQSTMYFLAIGFPQWDGYRVFQDPSFSAVAATTGSTGSLSIDFASSDLTITQGQSASISWTASADQPNTYTIVDENGNTVQQGSWTSGTSVTLTLDNLPVGVHTYTITFTDMDGNSVSDSVTITVNAGNGTGTVSASQTSKETALTGAPGFELTSLFAMMVITGAIIVYRRRKMN